MVNGFDVAVLQFFANLNTPLWLDKFMLFWTDYVQIGMVLLAVALLFFRQTRKAALIALLAMLFSFTLIELLWKNLFDRVRPYDAFLWAKLIGEPSDTFSFPSGHSSFAFAIATGLCFIKAKWVKVAAILSAVLTAFTRVYISIHYATDVLVGAIHGILCGLLAYLVVNAIYDAISRHKAKKAAVAGAAPEGAEPSAPPPQQE